MYLMRRIALSALTVALAACSAPQATATDAGVASDAVVGCSMDSRAEAYAANLAKMGQSGAIKFVLTASDPAPPAKGNNTWTLKLLDAAAKPMPGATVGVKAFMPDHGHGSSVVPQVTPAADGSYTVAPLYLFMPGLWQITFTVDGAVPDKVVFSFCVAG
jgi:hypothetical protein